MEKNPLQNAWKQFEQTGTIADYLWYKTVEQKGGAFFDCQNPRDRLGADPDAGSGLKVNHSHGGYGTD